MWNPNQYEKFKSARSAPFYDLLKMVNVRPNLKVVDLGCGTGELTRALADYLPDSDVLGMDNSPEMLAKSAPFARPGLRFEQGNIEDLDGEWDLIFSNAALQWVIIDHHELMACLMEMVRPGGQLVVQMPSNHGHLTHTALREIALTSPFDTYFRGETRRSPVLGIEDYAEILYQNGGQEIVVYEKIYPQMMENAAGLMEWTKGTAMIPYMDKLPEPLRGDFQAAYLAKLTERYGAGEVFYAFRRTLFAATHGV